MVNGLIVMKLQRNVMESVRKDCQQRENAILEMIKHPLDGGKATINRIR